MIYKKPWWDSIWPLSQILLFLLFWTVLFGEIQRWDRHCVDPETARWAAAVMDAAPLEGAHWEGVELHVGEFTSAGGAYLDGRLVRLQAAFVLEAPREHVTGVLMHELGHLRPGRSTSSPEQGLWSGAFSIASEEQDEADRFAVEALNASGAESHGLADYLDVALRTEMRDHAYRTLQRLGWTDPFSYARTTGARISAARQSARPGRPLLSDSLWQARRTICQERAWRRLS